MFGGFIQHQGHLAASTRKGDISELIISFSSQAFSDKLSIGRSVAVNGVCLTVTAFSSSSFTVECSRETINKSAFKQLPLQSSVNLELPITLNTLLDGHIVSGHIDTVGTLKKIEKSSGNIEMTFSYETTFRKHLVEKGSITVNGISLTAFNVTSNTFTISVISHTFEATNFKDLRELSDVNLEFDMLGKYILNIGEKNNEGITMKTLAKHGFM